jgi:hypothetical protein
MNAQRSSQSFLNASIVFASWFGCRGRALT